MERTKMWCNKGATTLLSPQLIQIFFCWKIEGPPRITLTLFPICIALLSKYYPSSNFCDTKLLRFQKFFWKNIKHLKINLMLFYRSSIILDPSFEQHSMYLVYTFLLRLVRNLSAQLIDIVWTSTHSRSNSRNIFFFMFSSCYSGC